MKSRLLGTIVGLLCSIPVAFVFVEIVTTSSGWYYSRVVSLFLIPIVGVLVGYICGGVISDKKK